MAGRQRPSFLKRQKEQKRMERAAEKRERRLKKRGGTPQADDALEPDTDPIGLTDSDEAASTGTDDKV
jgi:hypothetical protein